VVDPLNRIKYDLENGNWRVLWGGRPTKDTYRTAEEAYAHLDALKRGARAVEY
jgi:hypothetical protein